MKSNVLVFVVVLFAAKAVIGQGVTDQQILLGQSCALQGPAASLGKGMQAGLQAAFAEANGAGGINGRKIELVSVNDGYEPKKCQIATRMLLEKRKVFALIGGVGTPTAKVALPMAEEADAPFLFPFTGAGFLRAPEREATLNVRASYDQEMVELARHLVEERGFKKIACFWQNDGYGQVGLAGIKKALAAKGMELVGDANYKRNTLAVAPGAKKLAALEPDAIVMVGAYKPCAAFIKVAKKTPGLQNATFCNISFVGTKALLKELGDAAEGVIVSQVVPFPWDTSVPAVQRYHNAMKAAGKADEIGFISLEGYLAGLIFKDIAGRVEGDFTRQSFIAAARSAGTMDLGGLSLSYGEGDHVGLEQVWLTKFAGGKVVPMTDPANLGN